MAHHVRERSEAVAPPPSRPKRREPFDAMVGARVRLRREMLNMSQTDVASRIGISFQQFQKYEKGVNRIGGSRLVQIANVLGVSPAWFFERVGAPAEPDEALVSIYKFMASSEGRALSRAFQRLPAPVRRAVVALVEQCADEAR